ncbi:hypothetical protein EYF80_010670 [Liparis tanakae]|uniref:Uncharacterized protein n=1 Tax=Liparis tanakae TaxID=230148 RepID=A0A4Z2IMH8_9TELE|nr:hypothetical protein EYF80_010670 [Liparis tanakae]
MSGAEEAGGEDDQRTRLPLRKIKYLLNTSANFHMGPRPAGPTEDSINPPEVDPGRQLNAVTSKQSFPPEKKRAREIR